MKRYIVCLIAIPLVLLAQSFYEVNSSLRVHGTVITGFNGGKTGASLWQGATSGGAGYAVSDTAGAASLYLIPTPTGSTGVAMVNNGTTTCPTLDPAVGSPTCYQMAWASVAGALPTGSTGNMVYYAANGSVVSVLNLAFTTLTDGATITWAVASTPIASAKVTLGGNRTLNVTNLVNGGDYTLEVIQDGTGSRGLTLGTGCTWKVLNGGGGAITPSTSAGAIDVLAWKYDGTNCIASFAKNAN